MLESQLQVVQQAKQFLADIKQPEYSTVVEPHFSGSAGVHMRHVLDHYRALLSGVEHGSVDYNKRTRFSDLENCPQTAFKAWEEIELQLSALCNMPMDTPLQIVSEVSVTQTQFEQVPSTLARELVFVSSHAIHHFSLLAVMRSLQGQSIPAGFGIAPATATFQRQQA
ncbi:hypothetical protein [Aliiglaciecola litoralis]|uniref:DinB family protein n=1 Tax=Aliiglaciecola litoralis TaxID=582857 RepID=A0ABP3X1M7_9ALTE